MSDEPKALILEHDVPAQNFPISVAELHGHKILLTDTWSFMVEGPHFDHLPARKRQFEALTDARAEIAKQNSDHERELAMKVKLSLRIVTEDGGRQIADKINRTNGDIAGVLANIKYVYPDVSDVCEKVRERNKLRDRISQIEKDLEPLRIQVSRNWGRERIKIEDIAGYNKRLSDEYKEKVAKAMENTSPSNHNLKVIE